MFSQGFFIRLLIAVIGAIALIAIIPAFFRLIGFPVTGDLDLIIKVVVAVCAIYYVFFGTNPA